MASKDKAEQINFEVRRDLANAVAFVSGQQAVYSFAALTPEELMDQQIERIEGRDTQARPNEMRRLDAIESNLLRSVQRIKDLPPEVFQDPDPETDVNTASDGGDV